MANIHKLLEGKPAQDTCQKYMYIDTVIGFSGLYSPFSHHSHTEFTVGTEKFSFIEQYIQAIKGATFDGDITRALSLKSPNLY